MCYTFVMTLLHAVILGIIEGFTEFLPISSTGHLILVGKALALPQTEFLKSFEIIIQLGAICSVVVLYAKRFLDIAVLKRLIVAFIPTGVIGLALYKIVKEFLLGNETVVLWALFLGGAALIVFEYFHREPPREDEPVTAITYRESFFVGVFQSLAIVPGVSRSGATIVGGLLLGLKRTTIVEFSFLLAVPTMLAATGLDLYKNASSFSADQSGLLAVGFIVSFFIALGAIKFLLGFITKHTFVLFGVYRIILALLFWFVIFGT